MNLTEAQIENLRHVRDHGRSKPRSRAGYTCRTTGLTEFVWLYEDGVTAAVSEKEPQIGAWLVKVVGEQLTERGLAALIAKDAQQ